MRVVRLTDRDIAGLLLAGDMYAAKAAYRWWRS